MSDASGRAKRRVMAVIDAGPHGGRILDCAIARAREGATNLVLLSVIPDLDSVDTDLAARIVCGSAREAIAAAARSFAVGTIVVGATAHSWPRCLLGANLLRHLMHRTPCEIVGTDPRDGHRSGELPAAASLRSRNEAFSPH